VPIPAVAPVEIGDKCFVDGHVGRGPVQYRLAPGGVEKRHLPVIRGDRFGGVERTGRYTVRRLPASSLFRKYPQPEACLEETGRDFFGRGTVGPFSVLAYQYAKSAGGWPHRRPSAGKLNCFGYNRLRRSGRVAVQDLNL
jgi:hypothetical protein